MEQCALIKIIVKNLRFCLIALLHGCKTTHGFDPFKYLAAHINAVAVRRVIHGICICIRFKFHHSRCKRHYIVRDQILPDNGDDHTCRSDILLNATVNNTIIRYIDRFRKETGGHVRHENLSFRIRQLFVLRSVDRIILADINVIGFLIDRQIAAVRDIRKRFVCTGRNGIRLAVLLCFLPCFLCPLSRNDIVCNTVFHQIHRNHCKLQTCAALHIQNSVIIRNLHQITKVCFCLVDQVIEYLGSVTHLHHGLSASPVIQHFLLCLFQHFFR